MDQTVVKRVKRAWCIAWLCVTSLVLVVWGFRAAVVAAVMFLAMSFLAFVAFILYLLLGDAPPAARVLIILLLFVGLFVEVGVLLAAIPAFEIGARAADRGAGVVACRATAG